jgi:hypothetical protein
MTFMKRANQFFLTIIALAAWLALGSASFAQSAQGTASPPVNAQQPNDKHENEVDFGSRVTDARARLILKAEKKAYEEHVARAKEAKQLAIDLKAAYDANQSFSSQDQKNLERLEKLTRRIRNDVGGSESDQDPKDLPTSMTGAVEAITKMADDLCEQVEKTPRHVVSASIIDQANKLIMVIQFLRGTRN